MYSKLSLRNIKRSISDYSIYSLTLTLAVALFYIFNCLGSQQVLLDLNKSQSEMLSSLDKLMSASSIAVAVIFCILCLFANQFLIKRRKKEFGLYMTLGMSKVKISTILILETVLMGLLSLVLGIILGIIISQGMSALTATLFDVAVVKYSFLISWSAIFKTIVFFILIFVLVMIFNTIAISKYTLIELLTASKKGQKIWIKNNVLSGILFGISLALIVTSYIIIYRGNILQGFSQLIIGGLILIAGSVLFYLSGCSFIIILLMKWKKVYYKGINIFNVRQLGAKISTALTSIIVIQFLLFFTITILSSGINYKHSLENELKIVAPYDGSISIVNYEDDKIVDFDFVESKINLNLEQNHKDNYVKFTMYFPDMTSDQLLKDYAVGSIKKNIAEGQPYVLSTIRNSDYIKLMKLQGREPIKLNNDETFIITNMNEGIASIENLTNNVKEFTIGGETLKLNSNKFEVVGIETENVGRTMACFVVPDNVVNNLEVYQSLINFQYTKDNEVLDEKYNKLFDKMIYEDVLDNNYYSIRGMTKTAAYEMVAGETASFLYIGIYLGFVFLVSCGAVLGLRLLSDASDEKDRYKVLDRIGASKKSINKSVLMQVLAYFGAPLLLAIPNSIFTFFYINKCISSIGASPSFTPAIFTALVILLLYGGYMIVTYNGYKKIVTRK